jgi:hypothetical protein
MPRVFLLGRRDVLWSMRWIHVQLVNARAARARHPERPTRCEPRVAPSLGGALVGPSCSALSLPKAQKSILSPPQPLTGRGEREGAWVLVRKRHTVKKIRNTFATLEQYPLRHNVWGACVSWVLNRERRNRRCTRPVLLVATVPSERCRLGASTAAVLALSTHIFESNIRTWYVRGVFLCHGTWRLEEDLEDLTSTSTAVTSSGQRTRDIARGLGRLGAVSHWIAHVVSARPANQHAGIFPDDKLRKKGHRPQRRPRLGVLLATQARRGWHLVPSTPNPET